MSSNQETSKHEHHHHHHEHEKEQTPQEKAAPTLPEEGERKTFWAHDHLEPENDPFEDDFCENVKKPTKGK